MGIEREESPQDLILGDTTITKAHVLSHPNPPPSTGFWSRESGPGRRRGKGFYWRSPSSTQALRCSRGGWVCRGMQAGCRTAPLGWALSPSARRRPNRPTGLMPRPVYQKGSMSGSAKRETRNSQCSEAQHVGKKERDPGERGVLGAACWLLQSNTARTYGGTREGPGSSLTPALLTPDFHGALTEAAGGGQGHAGEQQAQQAGGP